MGEKTAIGWCDHTFNPWWGCQEVSPACDHCYARETAKRYAANLNLWGAGSERRLFGEKHWREPIKWASRARSLGVRRRVFCASMADVFDNASPLLERERAKLFALIEMTPDLDWLLLTKRIGNVLGMVPESWYDGLWPANAWLGITVVNQAECDRDIPKLARTPAPVRFLSVEPMLEQISFAEISTVAGQEPCCNGRSDAECPWCFGTGTRNRPAFQWVIVGGESGANARPMHVNWARGLRDECEQVGVPFFFKQWGEWTSSDQRSTDQNLEYVGTKVAALWNGGAWDTFDAKAAWPKLSDEMTECVHFKVGRSSAGDWLDGKQHQHFPGSRT